MPKLVDSSQVEVGHTLKKYARPYIEKYHNFPKGEQRAILESKEFKFIGSGAESIVFTSKEDGKRKWREFWKKMFVDNSVVTAVNYREDSTPAEMKVLFYVHRIMHILFPYNFPKFYTAFTCEGQDGKSLSGTIRERIHPANKKMQIKYSIADAIRMIEELRLPIMSLDDASDNNFILGEDGGERYVDTTTYRPNFGKWNNDAIKEFMREKSFRSQDIIAVSKSIQRIIALTNSNHLS